MASRLRREADLVAILMTMAMTSVCVGPARTTDTNDHRHRQTKESAQWRKSEPCKVADRQAERVRQMETKSLHSLQMDETDETRPPRGWVSFHRNLADRQAESVSQQSSSHKLSINLGRLMPRAAL